MSGLLAHLSFLWIRIRLKVLNFYYLSWREFCCLGKFYVKVESGSVVEWNKKIAELDPAGQKITGFKIRIISLVLW